MSEIKRITTQTVIPIGLAAGIIIIVAQGAWKLSALAKENEFTVSRVEVVEAKVEVVPTRNELDAFKAEVFRRFDSLEKLVSEK